MSERKCVICGFSFCSKVMIYARKCFFCRKCFEDRKARIKEVSRISDDVHFKECCRAVNGGV